MPRIPLPGPDEMNEAQRRLYDSVVSGPRGRMIGPLRAVIHSPELAVLWSSFGEYLRYRTCLPSAHKELAIIVTARRWTSQVEWWVHAEAAAKAGIAKTIIAAIHAGKAPEFGDHAEADIYEFARQLQMTGTVGREVYGRIVARHGAQGVVELTAVIGYYTMVSMTLNVHEIPLPEGETPPFTPIASEGLTVLPEAKRL
ncbi:carboxymuconolactone decarboxylase family protein [Rhabdaerophilum sp. SD176]|uniref:carboxymuconolactone decarboxylase family protein n=1 Tax=Rhabdaerophilum sp. SD176 TaxID=2983548 RepID=UPI0024DF35B1|nr:carboxymuconolactone decarboxylase family protein [Rhabdaerophilum sp. SD176]